MAYAKDKYEEALQQSHYDPDSGKAVPGPAPAPGLSNFSPEDVAEVDAWRKANPDILESAEGLLWMKQNIGKYMEAGQAPIEAMHSATKELRSITGIQAPAGGNEGYYYAQHLKELQAQEAKRKGGMPVSSPQVAREIRESGEITFTPLPASPAPLPIFAYPRGQR